MTTQIEKPLSPADDDCCGGGSCNPCVWDDYFAKLQQWRIAQAKLKEELEQDYKNENK